MIGYSLQPELFDTFLYFRTKRYRVTGDIGKYYRCVLIHPNDCCYQSIIWNQLIWELNTVTYGTKPASFQVTNCLRILVRLLNDLDAKVVYIILYCFYMDDLMMGADTIEEAIRLRKLVHEALASAGFVLRKYQSNSPEILKSIEPALIESNMTKTIGGDESLSVLGLSWSPVPDILQLKAELTESVVVVTKRTMLSTISKIFDPLGLAAPVVIRGKIMLQRVWKLGLEWDIPVPNDVYSDFRVYVSDLIELKHFSCNCYVGSGDTAQLIGFCDASEQAYCAAVYVVTNENGQYKSELFCAKTRVAPVKSLTIPQLELQGAVLLTELVNRARKQLTVPDDSIQLYSDSTIVLSWLARPPSDWKIFVRNRVAKIVNVFPATHWHHVRSNENPADLGTRGLSTDTLIRSNLWLHGPEFIGDTRSHSPIEFDPNCTLYASSPKVAVLLTSEEAHDSALIRSCSSFYKLLRVFATVSSICRNWKAKLREKPNVESTDTEAAFQWLIRIVQAESFTDELQRLKSNRRICKRSRLRTLTPFIHTDGILRSKSRLQNAKIPFNRKCPVILPADHHFTVLYVRYLHEKYFHANRPFLVSYLSSDYLFVGGMSRMVKSIIRKCVTCRRHFYKPNPQQIANLPSDRVTPHSPFQVVGIDFTGAFSTKCDHHRTTKYSKYYAAIFVCFSTRAVHIELVPSLSTEDFLSALKCFAARRGVPSTIFSDNGTNFRGADRYLNLKSDKITEYASENFIQWKFNPPYTPHRGGIWEAAVKSAKRFLPIVTKGQFFTVNELRTLLTQIESVLNSRPIAYLKTDEPTEEVLTPSHFLIGRNMSTVPEPSQHQSTISLSDRYRANMQRLRDFWKLWSCDYLNQLRTRSKWLDAQPNLEEGQVVVLKDNLLQPSKWKLALILKCFPDNSGLVRTVLVKTDGTEKKIPMNHLIPLPISRT